MSQQRDNAQATLEKSNENELEETDEDETIGHTYMNSIPTSSLINAPSLNDYNGSMVNCNYYIPNAYKATTIVRHVQVNLTPSMLEAQQDSNSTKWVVPDKSKHIFQSATRYAPVHSKQYENDDLNPTGERRGDLESVVLFGMSVKSVTNGFPYPVGVRITGCKGNYYDNTGERYAYIMQSGEKMHNCEKIISTTSPYAHSEYIRTYPGMNINNVDEIGIIDVPTDDFSLVDSRHPVINVMKDNKETLQVDLDSVNLIDNRWYKVSKPLLNECMQILKNGLIKQLPIVNMNNFSVEFFMLGNANDETTPRWDNAPCLQKLGDSVKRAQALRVPRELSLCLALCYSFN